jgi:hypothetical protein
MVYDVALQQRLLGIQSMSALFGLLVVVYGTSLAVAAGGGVLLIVSPRFRRLLIGETPRF